MIPAYTLADVLNLPLKRIQLPEPTGKVIRVDSAEDIIQAIEDAEDGMTIIIAKGHYLMPRDCILTSHRVTIKGETGKREDVILDAGMEYHDGTAKFRARNGAPAIIKIAHAKNATIADLTIANNPKYGILFFGDASVHDLKIYNVKFHNIWARGLKGTSATAYDDRGAGEDSHPVTRDVIKRIAPQRGEVRNCLFVCDHAKRNDQDGFDADYIAGMDLMHAKDWVVSDNVFIGIKGKNGGGRGSIFIWNESENITVENNVFFDCDRGVSLGNPSGKDGKPFHINGAVIRNNLFLGGTGLAIEVDFGDNITVTGNRISSAVRVKYPDIRVIDIKASAVVSDNEIVKKGGAQPGNTAICVLEMTTGPHIVYNLDKKVRVVNDRIV